MPSSCYCPAVLGNCQKHVVLSLWETSPYILTPWSLSVNSPVPLSCCYHAASPAKSHKVCPQPPAGSEDSALEQTVPGSVLQFLRLVHRSYPQDPAWRTPDFLQTMAIITFPLETQKVGLALLKGLRVGSCERHHPSRVKGRIPPCLPKLKCTLSNLTEHRINNMGNFSFLG